MSYVISRIVYFQERLSGARLEGSLYEQPIGGGMENPAYDSTAFREAEESALLPSDVFSEASTNS